MGYGDLIIRSYNAQKDRVRVEDLERRCEVGPAERGFLIADTLGDPICRIKNSPVYTMLVAELGNQLVGVIQGSIKLVTLHKPPKNLARVGYILGLRVVPLYRRRGIGLRLVIELEEWFIANGVDYAYMATEKDNEASFKLFVDKLSYVEFRKPAILVNPVSRRILRISSNYEFEKLKIEEAESLYRKFMSSMEFFPNDIGNILRNKLSLGTWVAYPRGESWGATFPSSWAMLSVWNSGELFKLRLGNAPSSCLMYTQSSQLMETLFPCFKLPAIPEFWQPFGFYFVYGVYREGPLSGKLVRTLCRLVHNMAAKSKDCKVIVTEVGGSDTSRNHIPHWKFLSCPEDLWCIKAMKNEERSSLIEMMKTPPTRTLFVDPREV
ncbi:putative N-acetyltransferase HLS1-like isoform X2 [Hibiscus syriacus]|uniref:N-acetyltransferase HLS1-like isoform X2 n=1 Tax=Hibiscus syriacus TaxID=106335 RepID=A0A6A3C367_HIBSY|nr:probable N-acetyltransferase HLS1 [Hibiscus syriacus]KAE8722767.1 putative N-acetyltransferase HLS1-like isoform X2 [Hibiscus syriacus]